MNLTPYHANSSHTRTLLESHSYITVARYAGMCPKSLAE